MMPASNRGVGTNLGFPDVCNTPAPPATVPVPYPNIALNAQATPFSPNVKVTQMNALNMASTIPMTSGDEGGVAHPTFKGSGRWTMGNPIVKVNFMPAINLLCPSTGNNMNDPLGAQTIPSITNVMFTLAQGELASGPERSRGELEELATTLEGARVEGRPVEGGVGALRISLFAFGVPNLVENLIERMLAQGMRTLVLDLRGNRGGDPQAALRLADDLLDRGLPLCRLIDPDGDERIIRARRAVRYDLPLLLLVDGRTASAAEILTGALLQHHRAVVIGQPTAGKGTAQALLPSPEGRGVLYATVASFRLPDGALLDGAPIRPDIEIPAGAQNEQELEGALLRLLGDLPNLSSLADLVLRRLSDDPIDGAP